MQTYIIHYAGQVDGNWGHIIDAETMREAVASFTAEYDNEWTMAVCRSTGNHLTREEYERMVISEDTWEKSARASMMKDLEMGPVDKTKANQKVEAAEV